MRADRPILPEGDNDDRAKTGGIKQHEEGGEPAVAQDNQVGGEEAVAGEREFGEHDPVDRQPIAAAAPALTGVTDMELGRALEFPATSPPALPDGNRIVQADAQSQHGQ